MSICSEHKHIRLIYRTTEVGGGTPRCWDSLDWRMSEPPMSTTRHAQFQPCVQSRWKRVPLPADPRKNMVELLGFTLSLSLKQAWEQHVWGGSAVVGRAVSEPTSGSG